MNLNPTEPTEVLEVQYEKYKHIAPDINMCQTENCFPKIVCTLMMLLPGMVKEILQM